MTVQLSVPVVLSMRTLGRERLLGGSPHEGAATFSLVGKECWIAGGNGLIGREIVRMFRALGAKVVTLDLTLGADKVIDIGKTQEFAKCLRSARVDVWVNATYPRDPVEHFRVFLESSSLMAKHMGEWGGGCIINLASIYGVVGSDPARYEGTDVPITPTGYSAAKGGIIAMTRALACEYGSRGVRCNAVSPGGIYNGQDRKFVNRYKTQTPLGRMATPADVAHAVAYLATAEYVTGINLMVDGGFTNW